MKKMLILLLVISVTSTANAAITLVSSAGDAVLPNTMTMIGIYNDTLEPGVGQKWYPIITVGEPGSWTGNASINQPPSYGGTNTYYGEIDFGVGLGVTDTWEADLLQPVTDPYGIGVLAEFEFLCTGLGDVTITLLDSSLGNVIDTLTITQIPEPITFALLGLGGLFLRRRK